MLKGNAQDQCIVGLENQNVQELVTDFKSRVFSAKGRDGVGGLITVQ